MYYFLSFLLLFILSGCNEGGTNSRPYVSGSQQQSKPTAQYGLHDTDQIATARVKAEAEKEIARINMEKEVLIQKLKGATEVEKAELNKEISLKQVEADHRKALLKQDIALKQDQTQRQIALNTHELQQWVLLIVGLFIFAIIVFVFYNTNRNRKERLKIHDDKLKQELLIKEQQMRVQIAEKLIDAMASGKLTPEQENKLLGAYSTAENNQLEYHGDQAENASEHLLEQDNDTFTSEDNTQDTTMGKADNKRSK